MKKLFLFSFCLLSTLFGYSQTMLEQRLHEIKILPKQYFKVDTSEGNLYLITLLNPEELNNTDSLRKDALLNGFSLIRKIKKTEWGAVKTIKLIYMNRHLYSIAGSVGYAMDLDEIDAITELTGLREPPALNLKMLTRLRNYPLAQNQFFCINTAEFDFYTITNLASLKSKKDSLLVATEKVAKKMLLDVIRENFFDYQSIAISFQDRFNSQHEMAWIYTIKNGQLDDMIFFER